MLLCLGRLQGSLSVRKMGSIITTPFFLFKTILDVNFNWFLRDVEVGSREICSWASLLLPSGPLSSFFLTLISSFYNFSSMFPSASILLPSVVLFNSTFRTNIIWQNLVDFGRSWLQLHLSDKHSESHHCLQKHLYIYQTVCLLLIIWSIFF